MKPAKFLGAVALLLLLGPIARAVCPAAFSAQAQGIAAFAAVGSVLILLLSGILAWTERWTSSLFPAENEPNGLGALVGGAALALAGHVLFWIWFFSKTAGSCATWAVLAVGIWLGIRKLVKAGPLSPSLGPWLLAFAIGALYVSMLFAFPSRDWADTAARRFSAPLPMDNSLPGTFAGRLIAGQSPKGVFGDWLSSDRPPLQAGWVLLFWPLLKALGFDVPTVAGAAGLWFQLLWVPALWALAESAGLGRRRCASVALAAAPLGFLLFNSVYVWPKLCAAALVLGGGAIAFREGPSAPGFPRFPRRQATAGILLGLGLLCHGGTAFPILALFLLLLFRPGQRRNVLIMAGTILLILSPWAAYQHFYGLPGNRLLKMHLAGVVPIDSRGFLETLVTQYRNASSSEILWARKANLWIQATGEWSSMPVFASSQPRRALEWEFYLRSSDWFLPAGVLAWGWIALRRGTAAGLRAAPIGRWAAWLLATWGIWLALMFMPFSALAHQGPYSIPLILYGLLLVGLFSAWPRFAWAVVAYQAVYFFATWLPAAPGFPR